MDVYVVIKRAATNEGDGDEIIGIYTERARAERILVTARNYTDCDIEEWRLDADPPGTAERGPEW